MEHTKLAVIVKDLGNLILRPTYDLRSTLVNNNINALYLFQKKLYPPLPQEYRVSLSKPCSPQPLAPLPPPLLAEQPLVPLPVLLRPLPHVHLLHQSPQNSPASLFSQRRLSSLSPLNSILRLIVVFSPFTASPEATKSVPSSLSSPMACRGDSSATLLPGSKNADTN